MNRRDFRFYQGHETLRELYPKRPTMLEMLESSGGWNCWNPDAMEASMTTHEEIVGRVAALLRELYPEAVVRVRMQDTKREMHIRAIVRPKSVDERR